MSTNTSWYYRPTNSPRYPSLVPRDLAFLTQSFNGQLTTGYVYNQAAVTPRNNHRKTSSAICTTGAALTKRSIPPPTASPDGAYQHRRRVRVTKKLSPEELKVWLDEIRRPTEASVYKFNSPKNSFHFAHRYLSVDGTSYKWHKLDVMRDTYKAMWNKHGSVKSSFTK